MSKIMIHGLSATVVGQQVTLVKTAGVSDPHPPHLDASSIVFNTTGNPAPAEFWKNTSSSGWRYRLTVEVET